MPDLVILTDPQARALRVLWERTWRTGRTVHAAAVARALWPDSPAWQTRTRRYGTNRNGAVGGTMPMKAGALLRRLEALGLASEEDRAWSITDRGHMAWVERDRPGTDTPRIVVHPPASYRPPTRTAPAPRVPKPPRTRS